MITWRDYLGIALIAGALILGVGVGLVVYQLAPGRAASTDATARPGATPPVAEAQLVGLGDRDMGRLTFRVACQECHTQGRQSFNPAARERLQLVQSRIRQGTGQMPAFPLSRLSDGDLRDLLAYISLPTAPEPTPTPQPSLRGVRFELLEATIRPGEPPIVRFQIHDESGTTIAPSDTTTLTLTIAGPTADYRWVLREDARRAEALPDGSARYAFTSRAPVDAAGTAVVATEGTVAHRPPGQQPVADVGYNAVLYVPVTDPAPVLPRAVVRTETCNQCHGILTAHGGARRNTQFCVMCHNATQTDADKRATAGGPAPPQPVRFRNLIHKIHTGEDLFEQPFIVYGGPPNPPRPIDLGEVHPFPKDRANCATCHEPDSFNVSSALERSRPMTVEVDGQIVRQVPPVTAVCTGCHDGPRTQAHAASMTTAGAESCATCHGVGRAFSGASAHRVSVER